MSSTNHPSDGADRHQVLAKSLFTRWRGSSEIKEMHFNDCSVLRLFRESFSQLCSQAFLAWEMKCYLDQSEFFFWEKLLLVFADGKSVGLFCRPKLLYICIWKEAITNTAWPYTFIYKRFPSWELMAMRMLGWTQHRPIIVFSIQALSMLRVHQVQHQEMNYCHCRSLSSAGKIIVIIIRIHFQEDTTLKETDRKDSDLPGIK